MCDIVTFMSFILLCCPEGTYVKKGEKIISFKRERDHRCPELKVESVSSSERSSAAIVRGVVIVLSKILLIYGTYRMYKAATTATVVYSLQ